MVDVEGGEALLEAGELRLGVFGAVVEGEADVAPEREPALREGGGETGGAKSDTKSSDGGSDSAKSSGSKSSAAKSSAKTTGGD